MKEIAVLLSGVGFTHHFTYLIAAFLERNVMTGNPHQPSTGVKLMQLFGRLPGVLKVASLAFAMLDNKTPLIARASVLFAFVYFIFPIDLIPDFLAIIFGLGFLDDAAVFYMAYKAAEGHIRPVHEEKALRFFYLLDQA